MILYTDGALDVKNGQRDFFGLENFKRLIQQSIASQDVPAVDTISHSLKEYNRGKAYNDDVSIMILERSKTK